MAKDPSPLLGYNNNIRHKNRVFHIQTEDSGVRHPHVITHLFMDGGRILKSTKTSYAEHVGTEKMADLVRKMMKDQHKGMLIALRDGQFDAMIDGGEAPRPEAKAAPAHQAAVEPIAPIAAPSIPAPPLAPVPVPPASAPRLAPPSAPAVVPPLVHRLAAPVPRPATAPAARPVAPPERVDVHELERGAARHPPMAIDPPLELQPPPAQLFRPRTGGSYSTTVDPEEAMDGRREPQGATPGALPVGPPLKPAVPRTQSSPPGAVVSKSPGLRSSPPTTAPAATNKAPPIPRSSSPPAALRTPEVATRPGRRPPATGPVPVAAKPGVPRYASARPSAIFGQTRPSSGNSIFGEDIISDKSLDEVIMSYLADDAKSPQPDPKKRK